MTAIPESITPAGLRVRAGMVRGKLNDGGSCVRHLELAADEIERLSKIVKEICTHQRTHGEAQGYGICDDCGCLMPDEMFNRGFTEMQKQCQSK